MVFVGAIFYPLAEAPTILAAWRDFMAAAPEELSSLAICWSMPASEPFPPELHGTPIVAVAAAYCGAVEEGERIVQPLRELAQPLVDASGPWPWLALQSGFDAIFPKGELRYWKSRTVSELSDEVIGEIVDLAGRRPGPLSDIVIWHHGGAMSRVGETDTAYGGRDAPFLVTAEASWRDQAQTDAEIAWAREVWDAMERYSTGGVYLNFPGFGEEKEALARAGYGENYDRLTELKAKYDPDNLFRMNINIPPAT
jgi:FAD/FMN-containing dehydrogenase